MSKAPAIIAKARRVLRLARSGYEDMTTSKDEERQEMGLYNAIVWSRDVPQVLENLRSGGNRKRFNQWFEPFKKELEADEVFQCVRSLRNALLKDDTEPQTVIHISYLSTDEYQRFMVDPPEGSTGWTIDLRGRAGWIVPMPDGSEEIYYVAVPQELLDRFTRTLDFPPEHRPATHLGQPLRDNTLEVVLPLLFEYLDNLITAAEQEFAGL